MVDLPALFGEYEHALLLSAAVARFDIIKRRILEREGFIRVRADLADGGVLEFAEFWGEAARGDVVRRAYTYHWQDAAGNLIRRWDSAGHYPHLPHSPHHVHFPDGTIEGNPEPPSFHLVLKSIGSRT